MLEFGNLVGTSRFSRISQHAVTVRARLYCSFLMRLQELSQTQYIPFHSYSAAPLVNSTSELSVLDEYPHCTHLINLVALQELRGLWINLVARLRLSNNGAT